MLDENRQGQRIRLCGVHEIPDRRDFNPRALEISDDGLLCLAYRANPLLAISLDCLLLRPVGGIGSPHSFLQSHEFGRSHRSRILLRSGHTLNPNALRRTIPKPETSHRPSTCLMGATSALSGERREQSRPRRNHSRATASTRMPGDPSGAWSRPRGDPAHSYATGEARCRCPPSRHPEPGSLVTPLVIPRRGGAETLHAIPPAAVPGDAAVDAERSIVDSVC